MAGSGAQFPFGSFLQGCTAPPPGRDAAPDETPPSPGRDAAAARTRRRRRRDETPPPGRDAAAGTRRHGQDETPQLLSPHEQVHGNALEACINRPTEGAVQVHFVSTTSRKPLTWQQVLDGLLEPSHSSVRDVLTSVLQNDVDFKAFYFECLPVSPVSLNTTLFEFVLLNAPQLEDVQGDPQVFGDKFASLREGEYATIFHNLGHDAVLVVPAPLPRQCWSDCGHFASFVRGDTPWKNIDELWKKLGEAIAEQLQQSTQAIWVSTDGRSAPWVHLRLDSRPKYIKWAGYRKTSSVAGH